MKLLASAAGQWGPKGCPANPSMELQFGEVVAQSEKQREGDAAHFVFAETFRSGVPAIGSLAPNGAVITDEMVECSQDIVRDIVDTRKSIPGPLAEFFVEYSFNPAKNVHPENVGRADAILIDYDGMRVFGWEYKFGHRFVDAYENWQMINAFIGVMENLQLPRIAWPQWRFISTIAQPRNYHPDGSLREWVFTGDQLLAYSDMLRRSADDAQLPNAMMKTGDHCRDCHGRHACGALQQAALSLVDMSLERSPQELPPEALGLMLATINDAEKRLKALREGLEEQTLSKIRSGIDVPHWKADYSQGKEKWTMPPEEIVALGDNLGVELRKPIQTLTPFQARKAGLGDEMVAAFSERPRGAMALVRFSTTDAMRRFK